MPNLCFDPSVKNDDAADEGLNGDSPDENAKTLLDILSGKDKGLKREITLLNARASIYVGGAAESINDGILLDADSIDSGKAISIYEKLKSFK